MKKAGKIAIILSCLGLVWVIGSFADINMHNMSDQEYSSWNMFALVFGQAEEEKVVQAFPERTKVAAEKKIVPAEEVSVPEITLVPTEIPKPTTYEESLKAQGIPVPKKVRDSEWTLLACLLEAEAGVCSDDCVYAVGSVVLNRVKDKHYPDTLREVIYQKGQYACVMNGSIKKGYTTRTLEIAWDLLAFGSTIPKGVVYQAEFEQGTKTWKKIDTEYFCMR